MIDIVSADIFHARLRPKLNKFRYLVPYLLLPITEFSARRCGIFSMEGINLFSLRRRDYGDGGDPEAWISRMLRDWNIPQADGEIRLMTMPRIFGYAFNPVNFWFCRNRDGSLRAVLAEVNNTFGEKHCYLCFHDDRRAIAPSDRLTARKLFHVSPFIETSGLYIFRFALAADRVSVFIDLDQDDEPLLRTSVTGPVRKLTRARLVQSLLANPLLPIKVIGLIHFQAVRLFLKRVRHIPKPEVPADLVSH